METADNLRVEVTLVALLHDQAARLAFPHAVQAAQVEAAGVSGDGRVVGRRRLAGELLCFVQCACAIVAGILQMEFRLCLFGGISTSYRSVDCARARVGVGAVSARSRVGGCEGQKSEYGKRDTHSEVD